MQFGADKPIPASDGLLGIQAPGDYNRLPADVFKYSFND